MKYKLSLLVLSLLLSLSVFARSADTSKEPVNYSKTDAGDSAPANPQGTAAACPTCMARSYNRNRHDKTAYEAPAKGNKHTDTGRSETK